MSWIPREEIVGMDIDWFATDLDGHVARFSTLLNSRVPESIAKDREGWEYVTELLDRNPFVGEAELLYDRGGDNTDWLATAQRGFFVFDGSATGTKPDYRLIARPHKPAVLEDLDVGVQKILARTQAPFRFLEIDEIRDDSVFGPSTRGAWESSRQE